MRKWSSFLPYCSSGSLHSHCTFFPSTDRKVILAEVRQILTMEVNSAFIFMANGVLQLVPYLTYLTLYAPTTAAEASLNATVLSAGNTTASLPLDVRVPSFTFEILGANGVVALTIGLALASQSIFYAVRTNDELFTECIALLSKARGKLYPRQCDSDEALGVRFRSRRKRRLEDHGLMLDANIFSDAGCSMDSEDRRMLAHAMDCCIDEIRFPTDGMGPIEALGMPLTPRFVASLVIALVSAMATASFRLVTG